MQGLLPHLPYFPAARDRKSRAIRLATRLVGDDVVAGAEYVRHLVVAISHDCLLERNKLGLEPAKAVDEHRPTLVPSTASPPQVERGDAHYDELVGILREKLVVLQTLLLGLQTFKSLRDQRWRWLPFKVSTLDELPSYLLGWHLFETRVLI